MDSAVDSLKRHASRVALAVLAIVAAIAHGTAAAQPATQPARPPNVLILMTDQQSYGVLGCAGNPLVKTPNLDKLASEGARITRAVCATPFCTPTRASIRTGQWPHTHGLVYNVAPDPRVERKRPRPRNAQRPGIDDKRVVLDNLLYDRSYRVEHLGKWHLGSLADLHAYRSKAEQDADRVAYAKWLARQGDSVISRDVRPGETFVDEAGGVFVTEAVAKSRDTMSDDPEEGGKEARAIGRSALAPRAQFETWLADRAIDWLAKNAGQPFLLTYSASPPHAPWIAPDPYYSLYDPAKMLLPDSFRDRPAIYRNTQAARMGAAAGEAGLREQLRCYYAQVTMVDDQIGRILAKLKELGLEQNTLVIFTSDHGDLQGAHGFMGKSVQAFYDEVIRVPLIFRYPPAIRAGQVLDMSANSVDLMPTILDYAEMPIPKTVQGRSLRPILDGTVKPDDRPAFCERGLDGRRAMRMIRTADWKCSVYGDGRRELFRLTDDPGEIRNLANDPAHAAERRGLERRLRDWMHQTNDPALADLFPNAR